MSKESSGASQTTFTSSVEIASVEYTIPHSADPWATWFNTAVTSVPKDNLDSTSSQRPVLFNTSWAYCPAGTDSGSPMQNLPMMLK